MAERKGKRPSKVILIAIFLLIFFLAYLFISGYLDLRKVGQRLARIEEENKKLARENKRLEEEIKALEGDPFYIEKIAREELGMVKKGEIVYEIISSEERENANSRE
ncbi:septum formation initiator family protein [bacterium]|nr:septum formation initiator family protein [bacterium]MBU4561366.1 septum formation initiator family protein [bacterium]MCG2675809.1 septum formation initiator family protein [bacterium]MCG2678292.1 septum formation initiator family protein [bacterium]